MFALCVFISVFPFFHVSRESDVSLLGVWLRVGRRHPGGSGARDPRGRAAARTERDRRPTALTLIVARRDRKYIITVPFNHFCIEFLLHARVERSHPLVFTYAYTRHVLDQQAGAWLVEKCGNYFAKDFFVLTVKENTCDICATSKCVTREHSLSRLGRLELQQMY